jgi:hypothetical protein
LFLLERRVKSAAGFDLSLELRGPLPFPSMPWHVAQFDRYSALTASSSAHPAAFKLIITEATISHFPAAFCMADSRAACKQPFI